jgi:hypothetical protein
MVLPFLSPFAQLQASAGRAARASAWAAGRRAQGAAKGGPERRLQLQAGGASGCGAARCEAQRAGAERMRAGGALAGAGAGRAGAGGERGCAARERRHAARASGSGQRGPDAVRQQAQGRYGSGVAGAERARAAQCWQERAGSGGRRAREQDWRRVSGHWNEAGLREQARVRRARVRGGARCGAGGAGLEQARRELMGRAGAERAETGGCGVSRCGVAAQERGHAGDVGSRAARAVLERVCGRWNGTARPGPTSPATAWKRRSCAGQRRAERRCAAHGGVPAGRAQDATGLICRKVACGAGRAAMWRLQADSHGSSRAAYRGRQKPSRRRQ